MSFVDYEIVEKIFLVQDTQELTKIVLSSEFGRDVEELDRWRLLAGQIGQDLFLLFHRDFRIETLRVDSFNSIILNYEFILDKHVAKTKQLTFCF